jgi:hypothetical protein
MDYTKAPPVTQALIGFLEEALSMDSLFNEAGLQGLTGPECLGFLRGARHAIGILKAVNRAQEEGSGM